MPLVKIKDYLKLFFELTFDNQLINKKTCFNIVNFWALKFLAKIQDERIFFSLSQSAFEGMVPNVL